MRLEQRVALVFGAGSSGPGWGNGKAAAVLYAREGARVIGVDRFTAAAEETIGIIATEGNVGRAMQADVTKPNDVTRVVAAALAEFGRIDILHNNVGIADIGELEDITEARWHKIIDANLSSAYRTCRQVIPIMRRQQHGAIVNVSSVAGHLINRYPYYSYSASKAALNHFTRAVAVRYAPHGIRANVVSPGLMDTPMVQQQITRAAAAASPSEIGAARAAAVPMGRQGDAWDVARAALFLVSDEAAYITGVCLTVDGGLSCLAG